MNWWERVTVYGSALGFAIAALIISLSAIRASEQKWCGIVTLMDDTYNAEPPPSVTGKRMAAGMAGLRRDFHC